MWPKFSIPIMDGKYTPIFAVVRSPFCQLALKFVSLQLQSPPFFLFNHLSIFLETRSTYIFSASKLAWFQNVRICDWSFKHHSSHSCWGTEVHRWLISFKDRRTHYKKTNNLRRECKADPIVWNGQPKMKSCFADLSIFQFFSLQMTLSFCSMYCKNKDNCSAFSLKHFG
jgi:hypothetical protein